MHTRGLALWIIVASTSAATTLAHLDAQTQPPSLADVAARTAERKDATPARTYGDADLRPVGSTPAGPAIDLPSVPPDNGTPLTERRREDVVRAVMPAVVTIESGNSMGTGFFVAPDVVLTNKHVVSSAGSLRLRFSNGSSSAGFVSATASDADLALVRVDQPPASHPSLRLNPARNVQIGEEVIAVGSALGLLQGTVTRGIVSAVRSSGGVTLVQTDAAINPGNSGGPLVDRNGAVVGVTTSKMSGAESIGFAIATDHAASLLQGNTSVASRDASASNGRDLDALNATAGSDADSIRERGLARFEQTVAMLARQADVVDAQWRRYRAACAGKATYGTTTAGRDWFGLWNSDSVLLDNESLPECRALRSDIAALGRAVSAGMVQAEEQARRSGVFPGSTRAVRMKYSMDWAGWER
jgi:S1-C subfamily serine protease